jgi:hypothetical protein
MRSKTKSNDSKSRVPTKWQRELAAQAKLRKQIAAAERKHAALKREQVRILKAGGKGWVTAIGSTALAIDKTWEQLRQLLLKLYSRPNVD